MDKSFDFTSRAIEELPISTKGLSFYKDRKEPTLGLYVTPAGYKTYYVRKRINGKDRRIVIGSSMELTPDHARDAVRNMKQMFAAGVDPFLEKERNKAKALTLGEFFEQYLERYSKIHKK